MTPEDEITPSECLRRWELPQDHPDSWIQRNATYRSIYNKALEEAARVAEKHNGSQVWPMTGAKIAAAIRALKG